MLLKRHFLVRVCYPSNFISHNWIISPKPRTIAVRLQRSSYYQSFMCLNCHLTICVDKAILPIWFWPLSFHFHLCRTCHASQVTPRLAKLLWDRVQTHCLARAHTNVLASAGILKYKFLISPEPSRQLEGINTVSPLIFHIKGWQRTDMTMCFHITAWITLQRKKQSSW